MREQALQAVLADPDDDTARLIYTDACELEGDPSRAELIRVQLDDWGLTDHDLAVILESAPALERLSVRRNALTQESVERLASHPSLRSVDLGENPAIPPQVASRPGDPLFPSSPRF